MDLAVSLGVAKPGKKYAHYANAVIKVQLDRVVFPRVATEYTSRNLLARCLRKGNNPARRDLLGNVINTDVYLKWTGNIAGLYCGLSTPLIGIAQSR